MKWTSLENIPTKKTLMVPSTFTSRWVRIMPPKSLDVLLEVNVMLVLLRRLMSVPSNVGTPNLTCNLGIIRNMRMEMSSRETCRTILGIPRVE